MMEIIEQLKQINPIGCKIELIGSWLWISGKTFSIKEQLKELGFFFSANKKAWFYNGQQFKSRKAFYKNLEELKLKWGVENVVL